jgi:hypothetical protein
MALSAAFKRPVSGTFRSLPLLGVPIRPFQEERLTALGSVAAGSVLPILTTAAVAGFAVGLRFGPSRSHPDPSTTDEAGPPVPPSNSVRRSRSTKRTGYDLFLNNRDDREKVVLKAA